MRFCDARVLLGLMQVLIRYREILSCNVLSYVSLNRSVIEITNKNVPFLSNFGIDIIQQQLSLNLCAPQDLLNTS